MAKKEFKSVRQRAAAIRVPYANLEELARALNRLPDYPQVPTGQQQRAAGLPGFGVQLRGLRVQRDIEQRNVDPWAPILALFAALSENVRAEEEKQAEEERRRAPRAQDFITVRALRFDEPALVPPGSPGTRQQATEYLMRWIAEQWSPTVLQVVKRCEVCSLWFVDRSK